MQAAFQKYTDNAVSKTVNLPKEATKEAVKEVFVLAYNLKCKGVTIYRDGSRDLQVLNINKVNKNSSSSENKTEHEKNSIKPRIRPSITTGFTEKVRIGCGNLYITVNYDENGICEVFTNTGRAGGCPSQSEATSRLVSIALRSGIEAKSIVEQLKGIRCPSTIKQNNLKVLSCPDAIGRLIKKVAKLQDENGINGDNKLDEVNELVTNDKNGEKYKHSEISDGKKESSCPECGSIVEHEGGCMVCRECGFSKCG
jgi:ribonucleoside-diphosphate reductase alpha chain